MRRARRLFLLGAALVVVALMIGARVYKPAELRIDPAAAMIWSLNSTDEFEATDSAGCGVERWPIKTMSDPQAGRVRLAATRTTIAALRKRTQPATLGTARIAPVETHTYRIPARLVAYKLEADSDVHLVVADPKTGGTMIAEFPLLSCVHNATPATRKRIGAARAALLRACGTPSPSSFRALTGTATVTGVGFFDFKHGQTGVAPNGIELHPVVAFSGVCRQ
jgi:hypothetical protein